MARGEERDTDRDPGRFVTAAIAITATSTTTHAGFIQLRDQVGGENADGASDGFFLTGTGNFVYGTMAGDPSTFLGMGTWALDIAHAWTDGIKGIANQWVTKINNGTWVQFTELEALTSPDSQDYIRPLVVPAPGAIVVLMMASGIGASTRRRRLSAV